MCAKSEASSEGMHFICPFVYAFIPSFIYPSIQQIFIRYLLCVRSCAGGIKLTFVSAYCVPGSKYFTDINHLVLPTTL